MTAKELESLSLDDLVKIAKRRALLDGITISEGSVRLDVNDETIELREESARIFLRGLIRGYDQAQTISAF